MERHRRESRDARIPRGRQGAIAGQPTAHTSMVVARRRRQGIRLIGSPDAIITLLILG